MQLKYLDMRLTKALFEVRGLEAIGKYCEKLQTLQGDSHTDATPSGFHYIGNGCLSLRHLGLLTYHMKIKLQKAICD